MQLKQDLLAGLGARDEALLQAAGRVHDVDLEALGMACQTLEDRGAGIGGVPRGRILHHKTSSDNTSLHQAIEPSVCRPLSEVSIISEVLGGQQSVSNTWLRGGVPGSSPSSSCALPASSTSGVRSQHRGMSCRSSRLLCGKVASHAIGIPTTMSRISAFGLEGMFCPAATRPTCCESMVKSASHNGRPHLMSGQPSRPPVC